MGGHQEQPLTEDEKFRAGHALFSNPNFRVMSDLLYDMEAEAVRDLRAKLGSPEEAVLLIRAVDRIRAAIRALAEHTGVVEDPIRREV